MLALGVFETQEYLPTVRSSVIFSEQPGLIELCRVSFSPNLTAPETEPTPALPLHLLGNQLAQIAFLGSCFNSG